MPSLKGKSLNGSDLSGQQMCESSNGQPCHYAQYHNNSKNHQNGLGIALLGGMGRFTQRPDNEHDDVQQWNPKDDEGDDPLADAHRFVFVFAHGGGV